MRAMRHVREHHASAQRGQRGKSTPAMAQEAQWTRSRMSREADSVEVRVGGVARDRGLSFGVVDARTGGGGRTILTRGWRGWGGKGTLVGESEDGGRGRVGG